jgi:hypothetical protein
MKHLFLKIISLVGHFMAKAAKIWRQASGLLGEIYKSTTLNGTILILYMLRKKLWICRFAKVLRLQIIRCDNRKSKIAPEIENA